MKIFINNYQKQTGLHRFLEGLTITSDFSIYFCDSIEESNMFDGDIAIFGGWVPRELFKNKTFKRKYYTYCSPLGQADLSSIQPYSQEIVILMEVVSLIKSNDIAGCVTSSVELADMFNFIYFNPICTNIKPKFVKERANYGFLGNNRRKHRNTANQISAISRIIPKEKIIVSNTQLYEGWKNIFNCEFESKNLEKDEDYFDEIATHRLGFLCSFSESFSYQALEYAFMGVPCIVSPCISWYPSGDCVVNNIDSPREILEVAISVLYSEKYKELSEVLYKWAPIFNERIKETLTEQIKEFIQ